MKVINKSNYRHSEQVRGYQWEEGKGHYGEVEDYEYKLLGINFKDILYYIENIANFS